MNNPPSEKPDWDRLETDVVVRIRALRAVWEHWDACEVPVLGPWLKDKVMNDLVVPNLELLATFCLSVKIKDVDGFPAGAEIPEDLEEKP